MSDFFTKVFLEVRKIAKETDSEIMTTEMLMLAALEHDSFSKFFHKGKLPALKRDLKSHLRQENPFRLSLNPDLEKPVFSSIIIDNLPILKSSEDLLSFFYHIVEYSNSELLNDKLFLVAELVKDNASKEGIKVAAKVIAKDKTENPANHNSIEIIRELAPDQNLELIGREREITLLLGRLSMSRPVLTRIFCPRGSGISVIINEIGVCHSEDTVIFEIKDIVGSRFTEILPVINSLITDSISNGVNPVFYLNTDNFDFLNDGDIAELSRSICQRCNLVVSSSQDKAKANCHIVFEEPTLKETSKILKIELDKIQSVDIGFDSDLLQQISAIEDICPIKNKFRPSNVIEFVEWAGAIIAKPNIELTDLTNFVDEFFEGVNVGDKIGSLERKLKRDIFGQDEVINRISRKIKISFSGIRDVDKPRSSFLFAGQTGTGKTETAKLLSKYLGLDFFRLDMTEYSEGHTISRLIGSPPGYVGHGDSGALLTMSKKPCVILIDEIEKAHTSVKNLFLQILDYGTATAADNTKMFFNNSIIIMTTNAGTDSQLNKKIGFGKPKKVDVDIALALGSEFNKEFLGRFNDLLMFNPITGDIITKIASREMSIAKKRLIDKIDFTFSPAVSKIIARKVCDNKLGTRNIKNYIENEIVGEMIERHYQQSNDRTKYKVTGANGEIAIIDILPMNKFRGCD